jgi:hypothetical protein
MDSKQWLKIYQKLIDKKLRRLSKWMYLVKVMKYLKH